MFSGHCISFLWHASLKLFPIFIELSAHLKIDLLVLYMDTMNVRRTCMKEGPHFTAAKSHRRETPWMQWMQKIFLTEITTHRRPEDSFRRERYECRFYFKSQNSHRWETPWISEMWKNFVKFSLTLHLETHTREKPHKYSQC